MSDQKAPQERLLRPAQVAELFRVAPTTVSDWERAGRIPSLRTPGGHRRFRESEIRALMNGALTTLDQALAEAREVADRICIDWRDLDDGVVTVLAYRDDVCELASGQTTGEALADALGALRAYRAGGAA